MWWSVQWNIGLKRHDVGVFHLAEVVLHRGLGAVAGHDVDDSPVVVVGEQDAFAEQLVGEDLDRLGVDAPMCRAKLAGVSPIERVGDDPGQPAGLEDLGELGFDAGAVLAGPAAGETLRQLGSGGGGRRPRSGRTPELVWRAGSPSG